MNASTFTDIEQRLGRYLVNRQGYHSPVFVDAGGSAALFKIKSPSGPRAIKVYDPRFLTGPSAVAERRRIELQRTLIGHTCPSLVQFHRIDEAEATAFVEMEFVEAPQLKAVLHTVPDEAIGTLIRQLVSAVEYLEAMEIVHRDIKPENIHVSADFSTLTLIDLGVARELARAIEDGPDSTDHGNKRPFIATAQYSSPEYLFRLTEPTPQLWKALSLYQVGAVLHDLITKRPLFQDEIERENKWLVARAVLTTVPTFPDTNPGRLASEKALASRCLSKDIDTRLATVSWSDFHHETATDPMAILAARLANGRASFGRQALDAKAGRLAFDRQTYLESLSDALRRSLVPVCGTKMPFVVIPNVADGLAVLTFTMGDADLSVRVVLDWMSELGERRARVKLGARLSAKGDEPPALHLLCEACLDDDRQTTVTTIVRAIARCLTIALDLTAADPDFNGIDLMLALNDENSEP